MTNLIEVVENSSAKKNFYPTPDSVAEELLKDIQVHRFHNILEPSAGKGDLMKYVIGKAFEETSAHYWRDQFFAGHWPKDEFDWNKAFERVNIECIEIDPVLRNVLESEGFRVVHDDFLTYETQQRYDLIVMNPPFDQGAEHLLKAIGLMQHGGTIACILNAETLKNPYTIKRQELMKELKKYDAEVRFVENGFSDAERKTDVEIALITLKIPEVKVDSTIMDDMRKAPTYKSAGIPQGVEELVKYNEIEKWVNRYNFEVACGIRLIEEYESMSRVLGEGANGDSAGFGLSLTAGKDRAPNINTFIRSTRLKYWRMIFRQPMITEKFTSNLIRELDNSVDKLADYEFSVFNILTLIIKMNSKVIMGVEETIIKLFDDWTASYWHEDSPNRHYYNGWKTNDCFRVGKKVIVPFYNAYSDWSGNFQSYQVTSKFNDIEKTFDYLDAGRTKYDRDVFDIMNEVERTQNAKKIDTKYFVATFYKKGTCHLEFKDMDLLEKFNVFASQKKGWLPPMYGKKRYNDMTEEEKTVVDNFQGKEAYEKVMSNPDYFLNAGSNQLLIGAAV